MPRSCSYTDLTEAAQRHPTLTERQNMLEQEETTLKQP